MVSFNELFIIIIIIFKITIEKHTSMPCLEDDSTVVLKVCDTAPLGMVERYSRMMREEEPAEGIRNNSVKKKAFHCVSIVA